MRVGDLSLWQVLGIGFSYVLLGSAVALTVGIRRARAAAEAYKSAQGVGPSDDFIVAVTVPTWPYWLLLLPPIAFLAYWLVARASL